MIDVPRFETLWSDADADADAGTTYPEFTIETQQQHRTFLRSVCRLLFTSSGHSSSSRRQQQQHCKLQQKMHILVIDITITPAKQAPADHLTCY
jgi:hypothetical protein